MGERQQPNFSFHTYNSLYKDAINRHELSPFMLQLLKKGEFLLQHIYNEGLNTVKNNPQANLSTIKADLLKGSEPSQWVLYTALPDTETQFSRRLFLRTNRIEMSSAFNTFENNYVTFGKFWKPSREKESFMTSEYGIYRGYDQIRRNDYLHLHPEDGQPEAFVDTVLRNLYRATNRNELQVRMNTQWQWYSYPDLIPAKRYE